LARVGMVIVMALVTNLWTEWGRHLFWSSNTVF